MWIFLQREQLTDTEPRCDDYRREQMKVEELLPLRGGCPKDSCDRGEEEGV